MDEFRQNNRLRGALDAALSGLNGDPALAQRVLRCAEEKPRAAKKLSVGLVFAFVALLAATENRHCRRVHHQRLLRRRIAAHRLLNSRLFEL